MLESDLTIATKNIVRALPLAAMAMFLPFAPLRAQVIRQAPVTDSSAQASPLTQPTARPAVDSSTDASPIMPDERNDSIPSGTALEVAFSRALNSSSSHNGESVTGVLKSSVQTASGKTLPAGTRIEAAVLTSVPAGKMDSAGELTLQVVKIGNVVVFTDLVTRRGEPGKRDMPDSIPSKGTEAIVPAGMGLMFHVPATPSPSSSNLEKEEQ